MIFVVQEYGVKGDGVMVNIQAIQVVINVVYEVGGGRVFISGGIFLSGMFVFRSGVEIYIIVGDILFGSFYLSDYLDMEQCIICFYMECYSCKVFIYVESVIDIVLIGWGMIYGNSYVLEFKVVEYGWDKLLGMCFIFCKCVKIEGLILISVGLWLQYYFNCEGLYIEGIIVINYGNFINDGLNVDGCWNVSIKNICIDFYDDVLVFKSIGLVWCENIIVCNCDFKFYCYGLKFGIEIIGGFSNIDIVNIIIFVSDSVYYKIGMFWWVIIGIVLELVDGGMMENIWIYNLWVDSVYVFIFVKLGNWVCKYMDDVFEFLLGQMCNIYFFNFRIINVGLFSFLVMGFFGYYIQNVMLENIDIVYNEVLGVDELFNVVFENEKCYLEIIMFIKGLEFRKYLFIYGFFV